MPHSKKLVVSEDIIPIGEFKTRASEMIRRMHTSGRPLIVTQNGHPAAVVMTPEAFDYRELVQSKVASGLASAKRTAHSAASVRAHFRAKAKARED